MKKRIEQLVHENIRQMQPYVPGLQPQGSGWIKLNTNELPYPPPPAVGAAISAEMERLARYPNPTSALLREELARIHGVEVGNVIIGNGSDDLLNLLARAFGGEDRITSETFPSYSLYPVVTAIAGGAIESIPFGGDFSLPLEDLLARPSDLLFLTCPNAPTGVRFPMEDLRLLAEGVEGLLVIDEAYVEFAQASALPLLQEFENVVLTRTFSKAYGLAGLRVGYAMAASPVIDVLDRIRDSYNVNRLSQAGALAALASQPVYDDYVRQIQEIRQKVHDFLVTSKWDIYPSEANFLFAEPVSAAGERGPEIASTLFEWLKERKILVRYFPKHPLTASRLRISIGSSSEMERFMEEITKWQKGA
ncbi:MAG: histidinol-phosphate transaminase [Puniceicoccaceae bacterium]